MRKNLSSEFCHLNAVIAKIISKFIDQNESDTIQELVTCVILSGLSTSVLLVKELKVALC